MLNHSERDWTEDFQHENGNYLNNCIDCKKHFYGHKRRVICNTCDTATSTIDELSEAIKQCGAKVTFGLTGKNMEVINRHISRFDRAVYSYRVWEDIGKEIGWVPLAAALWYFEKQKNMLSIQKENPTV